MQHFREQIQLQHLAKFPNDTPKGVYRAEIKLVILCNDNV